MGWAPGLVTAAGSLLNGVHLGWGWGSGSLKGPRNGEGGPRARGPSVRRLLNYTVGWAGSKESNLRGSAPLAGGVGVRGSLLCYLPGRRGAGSEPQTGPHTRAMAKEWAGLSSQQQGGHRGSSSCRNLSVLPVAHGVPEPDARWGSKNEHPESRGQTDGGPRPTRPAAGTRPLAGPFSSPGKLRSSTCPSAVKHTRLRPRAVPQHRAAW